VGAQRKDLFRGSTGKGRAMAERGLTVPDLVVLALLSERPMHGYALNAELEWREARD